jgi:hypothetical protein
MDLDLDASDIPQGPVDVEIVNGAGGEVWNGRATVINERTHVPVRRISQPGSYFLRLYAPTDAPERELLREFRFEVH